jgi:hypothetical protein
LVDKRKLKSIVVDTRAEEKQLRKEQRKATLESRLMSQPLTPPPIVQSEHVGATSSMNPPIVSTTLESAPQPDDTVKDTDKTGDVNMTVTANVEENVGGQENIATDQEHEYLITPEFLAREAEEAEERRRKENEEKNAFDTNIYLKSSSQQTSSAQPPPPQDSPPKDPTPPASSSNSHNKSSSESSPEHSSPTPSETASKQQSINEPKQPIDLQEQVTILTNMVTNLTKQVEDFQESKQLIDKFLHSDYEGFIRTTTHDFLTENLVEMITPTVAEILEPINDNLDHRIRSITRKMLSTTPFTLHTSKTSTVAPTVPELSINDMIVKVFDNLASKTTLTTEEKALHDATVAYLSKESCKDAAGTRKRSRKDDDPDPNSKGKKPKSGTGPSSSLHQQKDSTTPGNQQQPSTTDKEQPEDEEMIMEHTNDFQDQHDTDYRAPPIQDSHTGPSSPSKAKDKDATSKSKKSKKKTRHSWLDNDDTPQNDWLTNLVQAQPSLPDEEPLPGNTLQFTQQIMADLHIEKLTKAELRRINRDAQEFLKKRSGNQTEYEFHLQNIASAMSSEFDWLNPDVNYHPKKSVKPFIIDWTKPLPLTGFPEKPKLPYKRFFNKDLHNLRLSDDTSKRRVSSSLTISVPAARYDIPAIEETAPIFSDSVVAYDRDALLGIQHWSERRRLGYTHRLGFTSIENVKHNSKIIAILEIVQSKRCDYTFMKEIVVKRQDEQKYKFSEADFPNLNLNDIEDMYLEKVQKRMRGFDRDVQYNFISSLLLFIRRLIVQERVEDLQLGVESYQQKINLTKPLLKFPGIDKLSQLSLVQQPSFGFTYIDSKKQISFMKMDELHKFCDHTLKTVRDELVKRLNDDRRKLSRKETTRWNSSSRRQVRNFVTKIEERLFRREQIRRLESYIGVRPSFPVSNFERPDPQFTNFNAPITDDEP